MATATERATIPVTGMTCAACSARIQRTLERSPGVASANVNLMTNSATVEFDPAVSSLDALVAAIRDTGYGAELPRPEQAAGEAETADELRLAAERASLRRKVTVSLVAAALAMLIGIPLGEAAAAQGATDPLMHLMMPLGQRAPGGRAGHVRRERRRLALGAPRSSRSPSCSGPAATSTCARGPRPATAAPT